MNESIPLVYETYVLQPEMTEASYSEIATGQPGETVVAVRHGPRGQGSETVIVPRRLVGANYNEYNSQSIACSHSHGLCRMECKLLEPDAKFPYRKRETDAAYDIFSYEDVELPPVNRDNPDHHRKTLVMVSTGIALSAPPGFYFTIEGRSGLGMAEVVPFRGIIDATYTGELRIGLTNYSDKPYHVKKYERIAQVIVHRQIDMEIVVVDEFSPEYDQRGQAGFGSSGK